MRKSIIAALAAVALAGCDQPVQTSTAPTIERPDPAEFPMPEIGQTEQGLSSTPGSIPWQLYVPPTSPVVYPGWGDNLRDACNWAADHRPDIRVRNISAPGYQTQLDYWYGGFYALDLRLDNCVGGVVPQMAQVCWGSTSYPYYWTPGIWGFALQSVESKQWVMGGFQANGNCVTMYPNANLTGYVEPVGKDNLFRLAGWLWYPQAAKFNVTITFYFVRNDPITQVVHPAKVWYLNDLDQYARSLDRVQDLK